MPSRVSVMMVASAKLTPRFSSASAIALASGTDRARRSSFGTTSVSSARTAASAWARLERSRFRPVKPWAGCSCAVLRHTEID